MSNRVVADARRHHYVPRLLLRRFGKARRSGKHQIHVFDKLTDRQFLTAIENIAVETDFNAIDNGQTRLSLEAGMAQIEGDAAARLGTIIAARSLTAASAQDRAILCVFVALQFLRGPDLRARFADMAEHLRERVARMGGKVPSDLDGPLEGNNLKALAFHMIQDSLGDFAKLLGAKAMGLFVATGEQRFIIGDTPVVLKNDRNHGPYGNIGLAVPGIQIYLPVSPELALGFWCPTLLAEFVNGLEEGRRTERAASGFALLSSPPQRAEAQTQLDKLRKSITDLEQIQSGFLTGSLMPASDDNVIHLNSLQVMYAEPWVFSASANFELPKRMINDNPKHRAGLRMKVN